MNTYTLPEGNIINQPETVSLIVRRCEAINRYIQNNPNIYVGPTLVGEFLIIYVNENNVADVISAFGVSCINAYATVFGLADKRNLESAGIIRVHNHPFLALRGQGVLIGFVDTGIDYTNAAFKYEDGTTKIRFIWDQEANGAIPLGFGFGAEYTRNDINQALRSDNPFQVVPRTDNDGHGTFLASVAAGRENNEYIGAAPDSEIIMVKLKKAGRFYLNKYLVPPTQENVYESSCLMLGIEYIFRKSQELGRPVAICIGLGTNFGGHDGFSPFEEYLSGLSHRSGVCICTPAGNESQTRRHFQGHIRNTGMTDNIDIRVGEQGGDIYLSLWSAASDRLSVSLKSPTGEIVRQIPARTGTIFTTRLILENAVISVEYFFPVPGSGGQHTAIRIKNATPGIWTITAYGDSILDGLYHAWLPITGLIAPDIEFLIPSPNYTIVVPGTAIGVITCGAYDSRNNSLYASSSWGPTRLPSMAPDLAAPGVRVGGAELYGYGEMTGTSVATAITTGASALLLQWGIVRRNDVSMNTYVIKSYFIRGCSRDPWNIYPNNQWGYGRLNLFRTFDMMREV